MANRTPRTGAPTGSAPLADAPPVDNQVNPETDTAPPPSLPPADSVAMAALQEAMTAASVAPHPTPGEALVTGETSDPLNTPSDQVFRNNKCWSFYLHSGIGYPGDITVQFIGGVYLARNKAEEAALRRIAGMDRNMEVL